jgi:protein gp37
MAQPSSIEWTDSTWNPVTGCTKVSQGCKHCYAERMALRLRAMRVDRYSDGFRVRLHEDLLDEPLRWSKPRLIFVNSMSDLFHRDIPLGFIQRVFATMVKADHHIFQILTKRSSRLRELAPLLPWPQNVWMGVSIETPDVLSRVRDLQSVPSHVRFLSCEPLLAPLPRLPLSGIHWVIVGGESGPGARPMELEWVDGIRRQCRGAKAAFFFKQWGGVRKDLAGRSIRGRTYDELPRRAWTHPFAAELFSASA